ncbi:protein containing fibronectin type III domain [Hahella chejuensis KCTC 2396]|uniref:Protein containing fibronectin type III domain n=1 Tax=Hahella chejuensis (strain KCTC 2396) TaxID=349521 RepID=Q2SBR8_HAHCH|nr:fibronectin type III domain-containing protein [Hahella chejuensis]ABC31906.1 protein containing fibronectin type III domain [Hahella chejuensis KCTC 2396]
MNQVNFEVKALSYLKSIFHRAKSNSRSITAILGFTLASALLTGCGGGGTGGASSGIDENTPQIAAAKQSTNYARSAFIFWEPPYTREDGSDIELYELEGYRVYHQHESDNDWQYTEVGDQQFEYAFSNLEKGVHYFAVTVLDINGMESEPSRIMTKKIL